jgi:ligand-binding sensor domain-containing protein
MLHGSCPWSGRKINDLVIDQDNVWVATDSGAICVKMSGSVVPVSLDKIADKSVNTIHIVYTNSDKQIWLGTAGGLTVWHQSSVTTSVKPALKINQVRKNIHANVKYIDGRGREIALGNIRNMAHEQIFVREASGVVTKMNMNFNRLR